jgi:hypothetical protein
MHGPSRVKLPINKDAKADVEAKVKTTKLTRHGSMDQHLS